jgi:hypothetical protein
MAFAFFKKTVTAAKHFVLGSETALPPYDVGYGTAEQQAQAQRETEELHRRSRTDVHTAWEAGAVPLSPVTGKPLGQWLKPWHRSAEAAQGSRAGTAR